MAPAAPTILEFSRACAAARESLGGQSRQAFSLKRDPAMRWIVGGKAAHGCAASASQMGRFETRWLTADKNLLALADLSGQWIDRVHARRPPKGVILDMDSSVSPTHGEQEKSCWNGHYECTCYHPLFLFSQCRVPDGGGGHSTRPVRRHLADDPRTSAAVSHINGVVRLGGREFDRNDGRGVSR
jgi:hypothetical protein